LAVETVIDETTGSALDNRIASAAIGNIIPPELSISSMLLVEGAASDEFWFEFTVSLSAPSAVPVSVDYQTADFTATEDEDYEADSGTLAWAAGDTSDRTIRVKALGDSLFEGNEIFLVLLANPRAASLFNNMGIGILVDNDPISVAVPAGNEVNNLTLRRVGDDVELTNNGESIWRQRLPFNVPLEILGDPNAINRLTVDLSGGEPVPLGGLRFVGGAGENQLQVIGGTTTELHHISEGNGAGVLTVNDGVIHYLIVEDVIRNPQITTGSYAVDEGGQIAVAVNVDVFGGQDPSTLIYLWDLDGDGIFGELAPDGSRGDERVAAPTFSAVGLDGPSEANVSVRVIDGYGLSAEAPFQIRVGSRLDCVEIPVAYETSGDQDSLCSFTKNSNGTDTSVIRHSLWMRLAG
jgi:hypothetical protein